MAGRILLDTAYRFVYFYSLWKKYELIALTAEVSMYAIAHIKGFQYRVQKGDTLRVPRYDVEVGGKVTIPEVMLVSDDSNVSVGTPYVENAAVEATVTGHDRYDKVTVFKKKRRKDYSVKRGHHQDFTELLIDDIVIGAAKKKTTAKAKSAGKATAKQAEKPTVEETAEES